MILTGVTDRSNRIVVEMPKRFRGESLSMVTEPVDTVMKDSRLTGELTSPGEESHFKRLCMRGRTIDQ